MGFTQVIAGTNYVQRYEKKKKKNRKKSQKKKKKKKSKKKKKKKKPINDTLAMAGYSTRAHFAQRILRKMTTKQFLSTLAPLI